MLDLFSWAGRNRKVSGGLGFVVVAIAILMIFFLGATKITKGYEGALIAKLGSGKGDIKIVSTGWCFYSKLKWDLIVTPLYVQEYAWTAGKDEGSQNDEAITFQSKNSLPFTGDVGISFNVIEGQSGAIYEKYHKKLKNMIDSNLRNSVRDAFTRMATVREEVDIYGEGKALFVQAVEADVAKFWEDYLTINKIYLLGALNPPPKIQIAIDNKIEAVQKAQTKENEVAEASAEADKKIQAARGEAESKKLNTDADAYEITERAKAEAVAIELVNKQLAKSPLYIDLIKAQSWDGKLPQYMMGNAIPMVNIDPS